MARTETVALISHNAKSQGLGLEIFLRVLCEKYLVVNGFDILERFPGGDIVDQNNCLRLSNEVPLESRIAAYDIDVMELDEKVLVVYCQVSPSDVV